MLRRVTCFRSNSAVKRGATTNVRRAKRAYAKAAPTTYKHALYAMGRGDMYQLGNEVQMAQTHKLEKVSMSNIESEHRFISLSIAYQHGLVVTRDFNMYGWGSNNHDQIGLPEMQSLHVPYPTRSSMLKARGIEPLRALCGRNHTLVLGRYGDLFSFGNTAFGQLGIDKLQKEAINRAEKVLIDEPVIDCDVALDHNIALGASGKVYTWGVNFEQNLGRHVVDKWDAKPGVVKIGNGDDKVVKVRVGYDSSAVITESGAMWAWGMGMFYNLGNSYREIQEIPDKVVIPGEQLVDVGFGGRHGIGFTKSGNVYTWGDWENGRLGHGDDHAEPEPRLVEALEDMGVVKVVAGGANNYALTKNGELYGWGDAERGQQGAGFYDRALPTRINETRGMRVLDVACCQDTVLIAVYEPVY